MPSDVIIKILTDLDTIKWRISDLEHRMNMLDKMLEEKLGTTTVITEEGVETLTEDEMERINVHAMSTIVALRQARMAIYGYTRLLRKLGLPEDVNQLLSVLDNTIAMVFRLHQAIIYAQAALAVLESDPLLAAFKFGVAGGILALGLVQGSRTAGG